MAPTLKLTAGTADASPLDLSSCLRLGEDEGLDPADPDFLAPAFSEGTVDDGAGLVSVTADNKELAWPLHLEAASVPALHALVRTVRTKLDEHGLLVQWQTTGATNPTFWDLEFGRFDAEYRHWRSSSGFMLSGTLRCWVRPYGHTATERLVASGQATGVLTIASMSTLAGDVPALVDVALSTATTGNWGRGETAYIVSEMPAAHEPIITPSQMRAAGTVVAVSGGVNELAREKQVGVPGTMITELHLAPQPTLSLRVLAAAKTTTAGSSLDLHSALRNSEATVFLGPRVELTDDNEWHLVDLGVLPGNRERGGPATSVVRISAGLQDGTSTATQPLYITEVYLLPEDSTMIGLIPAIPDAFALNYDFTASAIIANTDDTVAVRHRNSHRTMERRGAIPPVGLSERKLGIGFLHEHTTVNLDLQATVKVRERFSYLRD